MTSEHIRTIALFFFFCFLDERRAIEATTQAVQKFDEKLKSNSGVDTETLVVSVTHKIWSKYHGKVSRGRPSFSTDSGWLVPEALDLGAWKEFQKTAQEDEFLSVIWLYILKIPESKISDALGVSQGTLRFRVGKGLRKLGALTPASFKRNLHAVKET